MADDFDGDNAGFGGFGPEQQDADNPGDNTGDTGGISDAWPSFEEYENDLLPNTYDGDAGNQGEGSGYDHSSPGSVTLEYDPNVDPIIEVQQFGSGAQAYGAVTPRYEDLVAKHQMGYTDSSGNVQPTDMFNYEGTVYRFEPSTNTYENTYTGESIGPGGTDNTYAGISGIYGTLGDSGGYQSGNNPLQQVTIPTPLGVESITSEPTYREGYGWGYEHTNGQFYNEPENPDPSVTKADYTLVPALGIVSNGAVGDGSNGAVGIDGSNGAVGIDDLNSTQDLTGLHWSEDGTTLLNSEDEEVKNITTGFGEHEEVVYSHNYVNPALQDESGGHHGNK
jgi:hypothetical protein